MKTNHRPHCLVLLLGLLLLPAAAAGLELSAEEQGGTERLILNFQGEVPPYHVEQDGPRTVLLRFLGPVWNREARPPAVDVGGSLLAAVEPDAQGLVVTLAAEGFRFSASAAAGQLRLDFSPGAQPQPAGTPQAAQAAPAQAEAPAAVAESVAAGPASETKPAMENAPAPQVPADKAVRHTVRMALSQAAQAPVQPAAPQPAPLAQPETAASTAEPATAHAPAATADAPAAPQAAQTPAASHEASAPQGAGGSRKSEAHGEQKADAHGTPKEGGHGVTAEAKGGHGEAKGGHGEAKGGHGEAKGGHGSKDGPVTWEQLFEESQTALANGDNKKAIQGFTELRDRPELPAARRPEVLHLLAQVTYAMHQNDLAGHFPEVAAALEQAINGAPEAPQVPRALLQLGLAHMRMDNLPEAKAYFSILRRKFPRDPNVAYVDYYLGDYSLQKQRYKEAAESFQKVIQNPGESPVLLEAAMGLARSLEKLEYFPQAYEIIEFIDKRWPRFYVENPEFLRMAGELANRLGHFARAKDNLWTYYNLNPDAKGIDVVMARLGDLYTRLEQKEPARTLYSACAQRFPDLEGGLICQMRLAEEGVFDAPSVEEMAKVFDKPFAVDPELIYGRIVQEFPDNPLAPLAQLKLAMWRLFSGRPAEALAAAAALPDLFPKSELKDKAAEVAARAFDTMAGLYGADQAYKPVADAWNATPFLRDVAAARLTPETRLVLATSLWQTGQPEAALAIAGELLAGPQAAGAAALAVNLHLERQDWPRLIELAKRIEALKLPEDARRSLDYALALALENSGQPAKAKPLWTKLAADMKLEPGQRGQALFHLSRAMGEAGDLRQQYMYAQESLSLLLPGGQNRDKVVANLRTLMDVSRKAGRFDTALAWAREYEKQVAEDDPEWPASRFKLAELYQAMGDEKSWAETLKDLRDRKPESLHGRMAAQTLASQDLERQIRRFGQAMR